MEDKNFSPEQSIQIIQSMIEKAKENIRENSFYFLLWGWLVFITALLHFGLMKWTEFKQPWLAWNILWIGVVASIIRGVRQSRSEKVMTYVGEAMRYYGISLGIIYGSLAFIFGYFNIWQYSFPVYILIYAAAGFFMGSLMKFAVLKWAGLACIPLMLLSVFVDYSSQLLCLGLAVLIGYIIPGHLLNAKDKKQNV